MASSATAEAQEWKLRADVLYHFHAYQYFVAVDLGSVMNIVNLTDADIQYYNRVSNMVYSLSTKHQLAQYLADFKLASPVTIAETHRQKLIAHVRIYNQAVAPRRRFYMIGLSAGDINFLEDFIIAQAAGKEDELDALGAVVFTWATDGCLDIQKEEDVSQEHAVQRNIDKCLEERVAKRGEKVKKSGSVKQNDAVKQSSTPERDDQIDTGKAADIETEADTDYDGDAEDSEPKFGEEVLLKHIAALRL